MQIYIYNQFSYLFASIILGFIIGIIYNLLNTTVIFFNNKKLQIIIDIIFTIFSALLFLVVSFAYNTGIYRWYSIAFALISFWIFNKTFGNVLTKIEMKIIYYIKSVFAKLIKVLDFLLKFVRINIKKFRAKRYENKFIYVSIRGFERERKKHEQPIVKSKKTKA